MGTVVSMKPEIAPWFLLQMKRLIGLKFAPQDLTTHWEALRDMPESLLAEAVTKAQRECSNFPAPWMLRSFGEQSRSRVMALPPEEDRTVELDTPVTLGRLPDGRPVVARREWVYYCDHCRDSGWLSLWCGPGARSWHVTGDCGRNQNHDGHEWVKACPCAATNHAIIRRKERAMQAVRTTEHE